MAAAAKNVEQVMGNEDDDLNDDLQGFYMVDEEDMVQTRRRTKHVENIMLLDAVDQYGKTCLHAAIVSRYVFWLSSQLLCFCSILYEDCSFFLFFLLFSYFSYFSYFFCLMKGTNKKKR